MPQVRVGAVIAIAIAAGVAAWLILRDDGDKTPDEPVPASSTGPEPISLAGLRARAATVDQPVYWAGRLPRRRFEFTETPGRIFVRYLPAGAKVGATKPYLTVATYRHPNAFDATTAVAGREGAVRIDVGRKGVAFFNRSQPTSVYLAYRGAPYQIEVFHPVPRIARDLVSSRRVRPIRAAG
jgi:hypothetical protein